MKRVRLPLRIPPLVPVRVEGPRGKAEVDALIDTGSAYNILSRTDAASLGYSLRGTDRIAISTAGRTIRAPVVFIHSFEILGIRIERLETIIYDISSRGIDAIIGWSFLRRISFKFDSRRHILELIG